jgi:hypothetical protein
MSDQSLLRRAHNAEATICELHAEVERLRAALDSLIGWCEEHQDLMTYPPGKKQIGKDIANAKAALGENDH